MPKREIDLFNAELREKIKAKVNLPKELKVIDLSVKKLLELKLPEEARLHLAKHLKFINLERNSLTNIDCLNSYDVLKVIKAGSNYISSINLQLDFLQELRLSQNYLTELPDLQFMPQLRVLDVSRNAITSLSLVSLRLGHESPQSTIESLDFSGNMIINPGKWDLKQFETTLGKFQKLETLGYQQQKTQQPWQVKAWPKCLKWINGMTVIEFQQENRQPYENSSMVKSSISGISFKGQPTLISISRMLEGANNDPNPTKVLEFLIALQNMSEEIQKLSGKRESNYKFERGLSSVDEVEEKVEIFVQNAQILVDNHYDYRSYMLCVLVKLTVVHNTFLVKRCFETLRNMMMAGKELGDQIIELLAKEVIGQFTSNQNSELQLPKPLLMGLYDFVDQTEKSDLLSPLLQKFFPNEIRKFKQQQDEQQEQLKIVPTTLESKRSFLGAPEAKTSDYHDLEQNFLIIFRLLGLAIKKGDRENVSQFTNRNLGILVYIFLNKRDTESDFYLEILKILTQCALKSKKLAGNLIKEKVYNKLRNSLQKRNLEMKSNGSMLPKDPNNQSLLEIKFFVHFSAEIEAAAAIFNSNETDLTGEMLNIKGKANMIEKSIPYLLIKHLSLRDQIDPLLIASLCKLALAILQQPFIQDSPDNLQAVIDAIDSMNELLPYLGMMKYPELQKLADKHNDGSGSYVKGDHETDENPICHQVFISIINVINFFCEGHLAGPHKSRKGTEQNDEATANIIESFLKQPLNTEMEKSNELKQKYKEVSMKLDKQDREKALFKCLDVPDDDVKLAVVQCLFNVDLEQLEPDEVSNLIRVMRQRNVGAGQTELVLSHIFWIFSKFQLDPIKKDELKNFLGDAVKQGLVILDQNQNRHVENKEEMKEKYILSTTIISFLKLMSQQQEKKIKWDHAVLRKVLYAEYKFTVDPGYQLVPIELEDTELGKSMDRLLDLLIVNHEDQNTIQPYNYVSFRLLHRMANLLSYVKQKPPFHTFQKTKKIMSEMASYYKKNLKGKMDFEKGLWNNIDSNLVNELRNKEGFNFTSFRSNHEYFTNKRCQDGIYHLITFLVQKNKENEVWIQENSTNLNFVMETPTLIHQKAGFSDNNEPSGVDLKKQSFQDYLANTDSIKTDFQSMNNCFQDEKLGKGYEEFLQLQLKHQKVEELKNEQADDDTQLGIRNKEMRVLCVSALLRIIYASIQFAPNKQLSEQAIKNLGEGKFYTELTKLCNSTGWFEGNIGVKFLMVMRFTTLVEHKQRCIKLAEYEKYFLFAQVVRQVLSKLDKEIHGDSNQTKQKMKPEKHLLINQISTLCFQLCHQCTLVEPPVKEKEEVTKSKKAKVTPNNLLGRSKCLKNSETEQRMENYFNTLSNRLENLFTFNMVKTLVAILFQDMEQAFKVFSGKSDQDMSDEEEESNLDDQVFFEVRNAKISTREHIKNFLGLLISLCSKEMQYKIIEHITRSIIFEYKVMRKSIYNEILILSKQERTTRNLSLQYFENISNKEDRFNLWHDIQRDKIGPEDEHSVLARVVQLQIWSSSVFDDDYQLDARYQEGVNDGKDAYFTRFLVFTNRGIYVFNDGSEDPCQVCEPQMLCPNGNKPKLLFKFKYTQLEFMRKFNLAVQKMFLTFFIEKGSDSAKQYAQYFGGSTDDSKPRLLTLAILFHRINGAYFIQSTIDKFMNFNQMKLKMQIDFLLEYSLYHNAVKSIKKSEGIANKEKFQNVKPEIVRYVCYFESQEELDNFSKAQQQEDAETGKHESYKLTYDAVPMKSTQFKDGSKSYSLPNMRILVISGFRLMLFEEHNSMWQPYNLLHVTQSLKTFKSETTKSSYQETDKKSTIIDQGHTRIKETAEDLTELVKAYPLCNLLEINSPNQNMPVLDLVFAVDGKREHAVLVFVGDLSREQVLELLIELRTNPESENEEENYN